MARVKTIGRMLIVSNLACLLAPSGLCARQPLGDPLVEWMNRIANQELDQRKMAINQIRTVAQAERRKQLVRSELLRLLGGLPDYQGPLNVRITGQLRSKWYTIDKVVYESLPGFYVTANVYHPNQPGRYPAVLVQAGHTQEGKPENQRLAASLARKGFVVLTFDPIGQGEREQTYSRQLEGPLAGWSVPEHIQMGAQALLIGEGLARYFIWDAMRSLDYLASRADVDASRIGATGCSGGGALTTFIGALDPKLTVVIPACYPSSFRKLFATGGPDTEMVFPGLLASHLDTADFVELSAPTPWLLEATQDDEYHFTPAGVRLVYEEARKWYALYGAEDRIGFFLGPGPHGMPLVAREAVYKWMIRYLKNTHRDFDEQPVPMYTNHQLLVTKSGNVEDLPGSRKLYQILLADFRARERPGTISGLKAELRRLKIPTDGSAPRVTVLHEQSEPEFQRDDIEYESEPGVEIQAKFYIPRGTGKRPAVLIVADGIHNDVMPSTDRLAEMMAVGGRVVLEMAPRHSSAEVGNEGEGPFTGDWMSNLQANLIGDNLPALRAHDVLRGVDMLEARADVEPRSIRALARSVRGIWLLLAAAADPRIEEIWLDRTPYSLDLALENSMARDLWDAVIPGFVLHWDLEDLVKAMGKRQVMWTDPTNWMGQVVSLGAPFKYRYVVGNTTDYAHAQEDAYVRDFLH
jgi:cephalosporin-C deacetylase-like acetyl esterase